MAGDFRYDIVEEIGVLSENAKGWRKELNLISWNGATPKGSERRETVRSLSTAGA